MGTLQLRGVSKTPMRTVPEWLVHQPCVSPQDPSVDPYAAAANAAAAVSAASTAESQGEDGD